MVLRCPGSDFTALRKSVLAEAVELHLVDGRASGDERGNLGNDRAETLGVLRCEQHGYVEDLREANQELRVADQLLLIEDGRKQLFLDIDDDQSALVRLQRTARDFGGVQRFDSTAVTMRPLTCCREYTRTHMHSIVAICGGAEIRSRRFRGAGCQERQGFL